MFSVFGSALSWRASVIFLLIATLTACGAGSEGDPTSTGNTGPRGKAPDFQDLIGTWVESCEQDPEDASQWTVQTLVITVDGFTSTTNYFSDANCSNISGAESQFTGTATLGNKIETPNGWNATEVDLVINESGANAFDILSIENGRLYAGDMDKLLDGSIAEKRPVNIFTGSSKVKTTGGNGNTTLRGEVPTAANMAGTWVGLCELSDDPVPQYQKVTITIDSVDYTKLLARLDSYSNADSTCSTEPTSVDLTVIATYGSAFETANGWRAAPIDLDFGDLGEKEYGIVSVENGKMYFGLITDTLDGFIAEKRPVLIDESSYFLKQ